MNNNCALKAAPQQHVERKTLMNSVDRLQETVQSFRELKVLSDKLLDKFERNCNPKGCNELDCDKEGKVNIVDLFNNINSELNELFNGIGSNIAKVVDMID